MQLTKKQLEEFDKNGFLLLEQFAPHRECDIILEIAKVHLKYRIEPIETEIGYDLKSKDDRVNKLDYNSMEYELEAPVRRLRQVYERDIVFKEWMENKNIRPILEQILRDKVVITLAHHNSIMTKMPHTSNQTRWHQDRRYWRYTDDNLISVWLALGEEYQENGVLEFIPGSHKMKFEKHQFDEKEYFKEDYEPNIELIKTKVSKNLHKGDVIIFHSLLLHRANKNDTDTPKISFVYTVKGSSTRALPNTRSDKFREIALE